MTFLLSILVSSLTAWASLPSQFPCAGEAEKISKSWASLDEWNKQLQNGLKDHFYASPTAKVGEWVLIKNVSEGVVLSKADQQGRLEVSLKGRGCTKETTLYPHSPAKTAVTDVEIRRFVEKNSQGLIYVWSPRMPLSQEGIKEIQSAAKQLKLPLLVLMEKDISPTEKEKLSKKLGPLVVTDVDSFEFKMRNVSQHYPAIISFKNKKILSGVKYGHEKADRYQLELAPFFK